MISYGLQIDLVSKAFLVLAGILKEILQQCFYQAIQKFHNNNQLETWHLCAESTAQLALTCDTCMAPVLARDGWKEKRQKWIPYKLESHRNRFRLTDGLRFIRLEMYDIWGYHVRESSGTENRIKSSSQTMNE